MNGDDIIKMPATEKESVTQEIVYNCNYEEIMKLLPDLLDIWGEMKEAVCELINSLLNNEQAKLSDLFREIEEKLHDEREPIERDYPDINPEQFIIRNACFVEVKKYMVHPRYKNRPPGELERVQVCW